MSKNDLMKELSAANTVHLEDLAGADGERAGKLRAQIMQVTRPEPVPAQAAAGRRAAAPARPVPPRVSRRLTLVAAAGALGVIAVGATIAWPIGAGTAHALTPPMLPFRPDGKSASEILNRLADAALRQPDPADGVSATFDYVKLQSQYLNTAIDPKGNASAISVVSEERWLAPDGSGRAVTITGKANVVQRGDQDVMDAITYQPDGKDAKTYGPGELSQETDLSALSTDPTVLAGQLAADRTEFGWSEPAREAPDWYRRVAVVTAIAKQQRIRPALWAAMLRVLASTPGLTSQGTVPDRVGRTATAVSFDTTLDVGRPSRLVLLFSPDTGAFLGEEHILTTKFGDGPYDAYLNVSIPAVVSYRALLAVGKTDSDRTPPATGGQK